jgi:hypothetical protein
MPFRDNSFCSFLGRAYKFRESQHCNQRPIYTHLLKTCHSYQRNHLLTAIATKLAPGQDASHALTIWQCLNASEAKPMIVRAVMDIVNDASANVTLRPLLNTQTVAANDLNFCSLFHGSRAFFCSATAFSSSGVLV